MKTINDFIDYKIHNKKITMVTCYDYTSATLVNSSSIDCVLVGDSAAMTMLGNNDTTKATIEQMAFFTEAVAKGINNKFIIADMPFLSYRKSHEQTMDAVAKLIQAGAHAIKLEGAKGNLNIIEYIVDSGVPVMGHIGLTPQHVHSLGGFKLQGKTLDAQQALELQAQQLQSRGCFAIVLECIPCSLAKKISKNLDIPTIGIGAGVETDGQVLVFQDLLGLLNTGFKPKFVKSYLNGAELITQSLNQYANEVRQNIFPSEKYSFKGAA